MTTTQPTPTPHKPGTIGYYRDHPEEMHPETSTGGSLLTPETFAYDYGIGDRDHARTHWSLGIMQYVVKALAGTKVAIVTDKSTGVTLVGVTLVDAFNGGPSRGAMVTVESTMPSGEKHRTNYYLPNVGPIITLPTYGQEFSPDSPDVFKAHKALRDAKSEAIALGRAKMLAEGAGGDYGKVDARPMTGGRWSFTYTPQNGGPGSNPGKAWHTEVVVNP